MLNTSKPRREHRISSLAGEENDDKKGDGNDLSVLSIIKVKQLFALESRKY
jgi:hypothetical protein